MVVGQFGSWLGDLQDSFPDGIHEGDVIFTNDPYLCGGTISHLNDWLIMMQIYHRKRLVGWTSMFGHQNDIFDAAFREAVEAESLAEHVTDTSALHGLFNAVAWVYWTACFPQKAQEAGGRA